MSSAIPRHAERAAPLLDMLEAAYKKNGKRNNKSIPKINLQSLRWGDEQSKALQSLQEKLQNVVKTTRRDPSMHICVQTDARDAFWETADAV